MDDLRTCEIDGISFAYRALLRGRAKRTVILLHGWPLTSRSWLEVAPLLPEDTKVFAPDLPGLGGSGLLEGGYAKADVAKALRGFVRRVAGETPVHLVGHDMGVPVAYAYAWQYEEEVSSLTVLDVPLNGFGLDEFARRLGLWHFQFFAEDGLAEDLVEDRVRTLLDYFYPDYAPGAVSEADLAEYEKAYGSPGAFARSLGYYRSFAEDEAWYRETCKRKLAIPVLALGGEMSGAELPLACFARLAERVKGGVVPACGHYLPEEKPDYVAAAITDFIRRTDAR